MDFKKEPKPYKENDEFEQDFPDDIPYREKSAVRDNGQPTAKKQKNVGVYLAMALCLVALGVGAWATYDTVAKISDVTKSPVSSSPSSTAEANQTISGVPRDETVSQGNMQQVESTPVAQEPVSSQPESQVTESVQEQPESKAPEFYNYPVAGQEILNGFSNNDPVYNMTMDDWRTHDGLDLGAEAGQNVMSIGAGTVVDSYEDVMWGNVLIITHGDIEVRYCGLAEKSALAAGDTVEDGQILGTVGTVPLEEKTGSHLHLQMKRDGVWIDPMLVLKEAE